MIPASLERRVLYRTGSFWSLFLPCLVCVLCLLWIAGREGRIAFDVRRQRDRLDSQGIPVDVASLETFHWSNSAHESTDTWAQILYLAHGSMLDPLGDASEYFEGGTPWIPETPWPEEPEVASFLRVAAPILADLRGIAGEPTPVWQPLALQGWDTILEPIPATRNVGRLLVLEFTHAAFHQDQERALQALRSLAFATNANDWRLFYVDQAVNLAMRGLFHDCVQTGLHAGMFDRGGLDRVREIQASIKSSTDMRSSHPRAECAFLLSMFEGPSRDDPFLMLPSYQYLALGDFASEQPRSIRGDEAREARDHSAASSMEGVIGLVEMKRVNLFPAWSSFQQAVQREETRRRIVATAIGVKQYQLDFGHWPEGISDLKSVNLSAADWTSETGESFEYSVAEDRAFVSFGETSVTIQ